MPNKISALMVKGIKVFFKVFEIQKQYTVQNNSEKLPTRKINYLKRFSEK